MKQTLFDYLWLVWVLYFGVVEGIAVWYEIKHRVGDQFTLTHHVAVLIPISIRAAFLAWLAWHFLIQHPKG